MIARLLAFASVRTGIAVTAAAFIVLVASAIGALSLEPLPAAAAPAAASYAVLQQGARTPNHLIAGAIAAAPFTPTREPARGASVAEPGDESLDSRELQLTGTVVGDDSFALVSLGGGAPKIVRAGGAIGGFRLRSIAQGRAVFTRISDGERLELVVPRSR